MPDFLQEATTLFSYTQSLRRDFHMHPELGFREIRTGGIVAKELEALGIEVTKGVGKTGVVGLLEGSKPGPTLLLRFDMDALPISEETGAGYASQHDGVMHACGHDGHTAIGLTVAKILNSHREQLAGTVKFCFQPSEEGTNGEETGGAEMMAGAELFEIKITGKGGHGAIPDGTIDPIVAAAQIVNTLQTIVSRNVSPLDTAVISVTTLHSGTAFNVIPSEATLGGTIRTFDMNVRQKVLQRFEQIVRSTAEALGCQAEIMIKRITPALVNDSSISEKVQETARRLLPDADLRTANYLTMGAEDAAFLLEKVNGCFFFVGSANKDRHLDYGHHHPKFDFDEEALIRGTALMAAAAMDLLTST